MVHPLVTVVGSLQILSWGSTFTCPLFSHVLSLKTPAGRTPWCRWSFRWIARGRAVSPRVGRAIAERGGRPALAGSIVLAFGLLIIGTAQNYVWYFAGWAVLGVGMGAGLYDAAFASLGVLYGNAARGPITSVTLFGGLPVRMLARKRVSGATLRMARDVLRLCGHTPLVAFPLYMAILPRVGPVKSQGAVASETTSRRFVREERFLFGTLAIAPHHQRRHSFHDGAQLITLLQARGLNRQRRSPRDADWSIRRRCQAYRDAGRTPLSSDLDDGCLRHPCLRGSLLVFIRFAWLCYRQLFYMPQGMESAQLRKERCLWRFSDRFVSGADGTSGLADHGCHGSIAVSRRPRLSAGRSNLELRAVGRLCFRQRGPRRHSLDAQPTTSPLLCEETAAKRRSKLSASTAIARLHRRTWHRAVRAENTAIAL